MKLLIGIPYRDREEHLWKFLPAIKKHLREQNIVFDIIIVEQTFTKSFNRAKLLNIAVDHARDEYDYYCFHDVDMIPTTADYGYCKTAAHLATEASQFNYRMPYSGYFGGVTMFSTETFKKINGYSNEYWGWGGEDDDVWGRCLMLGIKPERRKGRYESLYHDKTQVIKEEYTASLNRLQAKWKESFNGSTFTEGLSSLEYAVLEETVLEDNVYKIIVEL